MSTWWAVMVAATLAGARFTHSTRFFFVESGGIHPLYDGRSQIAHDNYVVENVVLLYQVPQKIFFAQVYMGIKRPVDRYLHLFISIIL